jgi:DNA (cytosine-5)-methyltransferase 1
VDNTFQSPVIIDFFTGGSMLKRGLERAIGPVTIAAYVEIEAFAIFNLVTQMEQGVVAAAPVWSDVKTFPAQSFHGKIHGFIGGYPCQPFSLAGKRKSHNDPRHLWPYLRNHIAAIRPLFCFFENVAGHLNLGFDTVYKELAAMGYLVEAGLYSAAEVGATHERQRLFILAYAHGIDRGLSISETRQTGECEGHCFNPSGRGEEISKLDNPDNQRQRPLPAIFERALHQKEIGKNLHIKAERSSDAWPAPPGRDAHLWEESRTVKPGMGCTVDGYNFKDDLLRMFGNGVVEQTAEIAFLDLLNKHLINGHLY